MFKRLKELREKLRDGKELTREDKLEWNTLVEVRGLKLEVDQHSEQEVPQRV